MMRKTKFKLELSPNASKRLSRLRELTELETNAAVVRQSLQLYEYLIDSVQSGKKVFIGDTKEGAVEITLFATGSDT